MSDTWDVFVSHCHTDEAIAARITAALRAAGLRVFRAVGEVDTLGSISTTVLDALHHSKVLLAYYSADYPARHACKLELTDAYLAGGAEGDPFRRLVAINPERDFAHIRPLSLRDRLLPGRPIAADALDAVVAHTREKSAALDTPFGDIGARATTWVSGRPPQSPPYLAGRWDELWSLHAALRAESGQLTSPSSGPVAVLHGPIGSGKTVLAAEYARRLGSAFSGAVWLDGRGGVPDGPDLLWIVDDVAGDVEHVRGLLPADPRTACLLVTRDPRLTALGCPVPLADLDHAQRLSLTATHLGGLPPGGERLASDTEGSPGLCATVARLAAADGVAAALHRLHHPASDLPEPLGRLLAAEIGDDVSGDVLRVLTAASPSALTRTAVTDVLATAGETDRVRVFGPVDRAVTELLARGVLAALPGADDLQLPPASALALRRVEERPERAELLRGLTVRRLATAHPTPARERRRFGDFDDEQARAANRIQAELVNRVPFRPLPDGQGSIRAALT
ncbi:MAG: TIR domain-containing protein, partial [Thermocrispum sp.]